MTCLTYEKIAWAALLYRAAAPDEFLNKRGEVILTYWDLVQHMGEVQLESVHTEVTTELIDFLNRWGRCRLARQTAARIKKALARLPSGVRNLPSLIEQTNDALKLVEDSYSVLCPIGPTVASKILHLIHPPSFMMWDTEIRKHYQSGDSPKGKRYVAFLRTMRSMGIDAVQDFRMSHPDGDLAGFLCEKLKLPHRTELTKFLDEYNWIRWTKKVTVPPDWHPCQV